jgi:hypothetical protein
MSHFIGLFAYFQNILYCWNVISVRLSPFRIHLVEDMAAVRAESYEETNINSSFLIWSKYFVEGTSASFNLIPHFTFTLELCNSDVNATENLKALPTGWMTGQSRFDPR